jgi:MraZ protein
VETYTNLSVGQSDTRKLTRFIVGNASEVDIDAAGRVLIPDALKDLANFSEKVVVVGLQDHVELWDEATWKSYQDTARDRADAIAEKLGESGEL